MNNLFKLLARLRFSQNKYYNKEGEFLSEKYVNDKAYQINDYFKNWNLDACVIGISGGIDSAVVYYLMNYAMSLPNSPIKIVKGLLLPIFGNGTTSQSDTINYGKLLDGISEVNVFDLTDTYYAYIHSNNITTDAWTNGQLASLVRTPFLYYKAAELQQQKSKSIVVGTTNLSEGGYIGFYGKGSDGMCDLQPISDIYKSEVIEVAKFLNIPTEIINRAPQGDVFDSRNDEEMIGAPYWFLELYMRMQMSIYSDEFLLKSLDFTDNEKIFFEKSKTNIENLRIINEHKYHVGSPAFHLDITKQWEKP